MDELRDTDIPISVQVRFLQNVQQRGPEECWEWQGSRSKAGYGSVSKFRATHVALVLDGRPRINGAFALHKCDNPPCCNPSHLWWGTTAENMQDAAAKGRLNGQAKTHCKSGHEFTPDNIFWNARGQRQCRVCQREQRRLSEANPEIKARKMERQRQRRAEARLEKQNG